MILYHFETKKKFRKILKIFHLDRPYTSLPNAGRPSRPPRPPGKESLTPIEHRKLIYFPFFITFRWFYIILRPKKNFENFWKFSNFWHFLNAPPFELRLSPLILQWRLTPNRIFSRANFQKPNWRYKFFSKFISYPRISCRFRFRQPFRPKNSSNKKKKEKKQKKKENRTQNFVI